MTTIFILFVFTSFGGSSTGITSAEFNSQTACEKAARELIEFGHGWGSPKVYAFCESK